MPPKIRPGYPVPFLHHGKRKVGIAVTTLLLEEGIVSVVYVDRAFHARHGRLRWHNAAWTWDETAPEDPSAENIPELAPYVTTVKNGRYG